MAKRTGWSEGPPTSLLGGGSGPVLCVGLPFVAGFAARREALGVAKDLLDSEGNCLARRDLQHRALLRVSGWLKAPPGSPPSTARPHTSNIIETDRPLTVCVVPSMYEWVGARGAAGHRDLQVEEEREAGAGRGSTPASDGVQASLRSLPPLSLVKKGCFGSPP